MNDRANPSVTGPGPMSRLLVWVEDDHFAGWSCSHCSWAISAIQLDTTVAALAFNKFAQHKDLKNTSVYLGEEKSKL